MLKNPRHEKFAQGVADGKSVTDAYRSAGFSPKGAGQNGERLMKKDEISRRIEEIRKGNEQMCKLSFKQALDFLADCITTPAGDVTKNHPLCQSFKDTKDCHEVKIPDKIRAMENLAKLCGWNAPEKHEIAGGISVFIGGEEA